MWTYNYNYYSDEFYHHGTKGQKWGIRRYQNKDGSLTEAEKKRYDSKTGEFLSNKEYYKKMGDDFSRIAKEEYDKRISPEFKKKVEEEEMNMYKKYGVKDPHNKDADTLWDDIGPDNWDKAQAEYDSIYSKYTNLALEAGDATRSRIREKYGNDYEKHEKAVVATVSAIGILSVVTLIAIPVGLVAGGKALANKILG